VTTLLGNYRPGTTVLHRLPASAKLVGLFVAGIVVVVLRGPFTALAAVAVALGLVAMSRMGLALTLRTLRGLLLIGVLLAAYATWQRGWEQAVETVADLVALVLAATVLTATTPVDEILDTLVRWLGPFRRLGVRPERVALAFSLTLQGIPRTIEVAEETRDAALARGLQRSPRARLIPMVIRVVAHARATGDALHARGLGDE
jgi:biotin transport system permease protein